MRRDQDQIRNVAQQTDSRTDLERNTGTWLIVVWGICCCLLAALPEADDTSNHLASLMATAGLALSGAVLVLHSLYQMLRLRLKGLKRLGLIAAFVVATIGVGGVSHELAKRQLRTLPPYMPAFESHFKEHREAYENLVKRMRSGERPSRSELRALNLEWAHLDEETGDVELAVFSRKILADQDAFGFAYLDAAPVDLVNEIEKNMPEAPQDRWGRAYEEIGDGWYYFVFRLTS